VEWVTAKVSIASVYSERLTGYGLEPYIPLARVPEAVLVFALSNLHQRLPGAVAVMRAASWLTARAQRSPSRRSERLVIGPLATVRRTAPSLSTFEDPRLLLFASAKSPCRSALP
jgi:hypothetical protein